jgi:RNA polymerase sigma-70 factor (ECF subfamily)
LEGVLEDLREELVSIYPKLMRFALSRVRDKDKAEELAQEACLRVLKREQNFDAEINLIAYSITIIKNLINDQGKTPTTLPEDNVPDLSDGT